MRTGVTFGELFQVPAGTTGTLLSPPRIHTMMTGVEAALIEASGRVTLLYEDENIERATLPQPVPQDFFAVISAVQAQRKGGAA